MGQWGSGPGVVEFPDGRRIRGFGLRHARPDIAVPEFAVYLLGRDPGPQPWEYRWVRWRDFRRPSSTAEAVAALREARERAADQRVEIACKGGVGRTGTAVALLAVLAGVPAPDAVAWTRANYHRRAVETRGQRRWISDAAAML
ncbi:protein-tyrosine phosphatase family protein [Antrihabitans cavernicola]|uniref:Protein phosphatase n=1 Tax=Antrihabitans cavernicola TaxID=2495913 RepID=A0A5A7SGR1_9NOCA|nr:protein-tyrosine phosphatase family protein [Spelaeibacter cavernicola]KAA0023897.1 protein phosphatase [Spelaeibacter cavernicola]